jgi:hypothetical protein
MITLLCALTLLSVPPQSEKSIQLSLHQEYGRAVFRECRLNVGTYGGAGTATVSCVWNDKAATALLRERKLTADEASRLVGLARDSNLMSGGHIGTDSRAGDGILETLMVTDSTAATGVLVTSGNASFATGPRRRLVDWLHSLLAELQKSAK